ncbi:hypothetical protein V6Z12_D06G166700 [Gossypium hirsutum]
MPRLERESFYKIIGNLDQLESSQNTRAIYPSSR